MQNVSEIVSKRVYSEEARKIEFNGVHCNLYKNGQDYIGYHSDDESSMAPWIASLSFGATRQFVLQNKETKEKMCYMLESGSLLLMGPGCQQNWKHCVPKTKKVRSGRINLTFRVVL